MQLILTIAVAAMGSYIFYKLKIPAGALIGAIIFSAALNIFTGAGTFPTYTKVFVQAIAGAFIGQRVTRKDISELRVTLCGGLLMLVCMLAYTLIVGHLLSAVSILDLPTALVAAMPAGLSDTAIISSDLGADQTQSTLLATFRTLYSLVILPQLAYSVCAHVQKKSGGNIPPQEETSLQGAVTRQTNCNFILTLVIAEVFGIIGKASRIPAGAMTFSILAVAFMNVKYSRAYLPRQLKLAAQCITGTLIGIKVTIEDVYNLRYLIFPVVFLLICATICNYICAFLLYKIAKLDLFTSLFGSIPAGVSDMALIATDMGGNAPKVSVLQLVRYIGIFTIMPSIIKTIT